MRPRKTERVVFRASPGDIQLLDEVAGPDRSRSQAIRDAIRAAFRQSQLERASGTRHT
jgi:hypothetical protein